MRTRHLTSLILAALSALLWASPALAGDDHSDGVPSTTSTIPEEGIGLDQGVFVSGATVTPLDGGETTTMDEYHAATFMQSWVGAAFFSDPKEAVEDPPADLPVFRVDFSGTWLNNEGNITAYYATNGSKAWIGFPGFVVWTDPAEIPPPSDWFVPPERVIDAFNGDAELEETTGMYLATSIPPPPEEAEEAARRDEADGSGTDFPWPLALAAIAVVGALLGGVALRRRNNVPAGST